MPVRRCTSLAGTRLGRGEGCVRHGQPVLEVVFGPEGEREESEAGKWERKWSQWDLGSDRPQQGGSQRS